jgi:GNAT superfamily N-acetyltransferase
VIEAVRPAHDGDIGALRALQHEARSALALARGGPALLDEVPAAEWPAVLSDPDHHLLAATIDDVVVGYLQLARRGSIAEVVQVYVHPEARELGFGDWLIEAATEVARSWGCTRIEGTALPGDRHTKNLYERAGITARKITVSRSLQTPE